MRLTALCLGNAIDLTRLKNSLSRRNANSIEVIQIENCIVQAHYNGSADFSSAGSPLEADLDARCGLPSARSRSLSLREAVGKTAEPLNAEAIKNTQYIFYFNNGSVIAWNFRKKELYELIKKCQKFVSEPSLETEEDYFSYCYGVETDFQPQGYFNVDIVTLGSADIQLKLAISYALSQSVKLQYFNTNVQKTIDKNSHIMEKMRKTGRVWLMSRRLRRTMADIFTVRNRLNLDSEVLHVPEYFWKQSAYETDYIMTHAFLDIEERVSALNQKIDVLNDMFEMFKSQIEHRHFFTLEMIIVILIAVEIVESLPKLF